MSNQRYSNQFKIDAIKKIRETGSVRWVADMLGVQPNSLRLWVKQYEAGLFPEVQMSQSVSTTQSPDR